MIEIEAPDGTIVEFPGGTPRDVMTQALQRRYGAPQEPAPQRGILGDTAAVAGQFGAGVNERAAQVLGAVPDLLASGQRMLPGAIGRNAAAPGYFTGLARDGINAIAGGPAPEPQGTMESLSRGAGTGLVDAATMLIPAAGVARATAPVAGAAPTLGNRMATALAAQPGMQVAAGMTGGAVGETSGSALAGTGAALAVPLLAAASGRVISPIRPVPNAAREALVRGAEAEGIPLTAGQATGSRFLQNVESSLEQLPLTSGPQRAIREQQQRAFTSAVMRRAGEDVTDAGPATMNNARNRIGQVFDDLTTRNNMRVDNAAVNDLAAVENDLAQFALPDVRGPAMARLNQVMAAVDANGEVPGIVYRQADSALGRQMRETTNGDLRNALGQVRDALRGIMDRSITPADAEAWGLARRQYANLMNAAKAVGGAGAGAAEGQISPLALRGAVDRSTGGGYAFGRGDLNELARIGQGVVRPPPDSGTAGRTMAQNLLTGGGMASGGAMVGAGAAGPVGAAVGAAGSLVLPRMVQMLMNSQVGQAYLRNQAAGGPVLTAPLAAALAAQQGTGAINRGP